MLSLKITKNNYGFENSMVETYVVEQSTPETLDLEVRGSSLARRVVSLDKELFSIHFASLHPGV